MLIDINTSDYELCKEFDKYAIIFVDLKQGSTLAITRLPGASKFCLSKYQRLVFFNSISILCKFQFKVKSVKTLSTRYILKGSQLISILITWASKILFGQPNKWKQKVSLARSGNQPKMLVWSPAL